MKIQPTTHRLQQTTLDYVYSHLCLSLFHQPPFPSSHIFSEEPGVLSGVNIINCVQCHRIFVAAGKNLTSAAVRITDRLNVILFRDKIAASGAGGAWQLQPALRNPQLWDFHFQTQCLTMKVCVERNKHAINFGWVIMKNDPRDKDT